MHPSTLIEKYADFPDVQVFLHALGIKNGKTKNYYLKNLSGSLASILISSSLIKTKKIQVVFVNDKEAAAYLQNDIASLTEEKYDVHLFPRTYAVPYKSDELKNVNVLKRIEILNQLNQRGEKPLIIVSYPEAITEKVVIKKSLVKNTISVTKGETIDYNTFYEWLIDDDFTLVDTVYEPGEFSIRGSIIDVFSYAKDEPYRIQFVGDKIDSIRVFNIENQLSIDKVEKAIIIPDIQDKVKSELRCSFFEHLDKDAIIWVKDAESMFDTIEKHYTLSEEKFLEVQNVNNNSGIVLPPEILYETKDTIAEHLRQFCIVEFGTNSLFNPEQTIKFSTGAQPVFKKNFNLIADHLEEYQLKNFNNIVVSEVEKQLDNLQEIFEEIKPDLQFSTFRCSLKEGFIDYGNKVLCYTDHQLFERYHRYKSVKKASNSKSITVKQLSTLSIGDYVTHSNYGVGRFAGLKKVQKGDKEQEEIRIVYRDNDLLFVSVHALHKISKYSGNEGSVPKINKLGSPEWENKKKKVKRKLKDIADDLIQLYAKRKKSVGNTFSADSYIQAELESSFLFQDTPDQEQATKDVKKDMEQPTPMDRLICGDVGFGKTEIAIRAACKAVCDGKQVAVLVPTTILAFQHQNTFKERFKNLPVTVDYVSRFRSQKETTALLKDLTKGHVDILIGTHKLVSKLLNFKDLGLLIIDEEQKFGVKTKETLKELKVNIDVLTLTATPIPRTLHFSLMGARDLSIISTPPPNRRPVNTEIDTFKQEVIRDAIAYELQRDGQVFFIHNRISELESIANLVLKLVPDARIGVAHGQLPGHQLEKVMLKFIQHQFDVLISTNIIESGLDIPNANTIIIDSAHQFGMSDLHQMRGRVGRSNKKAFCYLLAPPLHGLVPEARKRLTALKELSELGDGYKVAMKDLDIRGAGNLLGAEQSGFINDLGFETYHKLLDEAVTELKTSKFSSLFQEYNKENTHLMAKDCNLETDLEVVIPNGYVKEVAERLSIYRRLDNISTKEKLNAFIAELEDRFGALPYSVVQLTRASELRWMARQLGIEKIILKNSKMHIHLLNGENKEYYQSEVFLRLLKYVETQKEKVNLKQNKERVVITTSNITSINQAYTCLSTI